MTQAPYLSPLDGRYQHMIHELAEACSEDALFSHRVKIEVSWLLFLIEKKIVPSEHADPECIEALKDFIKVGSDRFRLEDEQLARIRSIEKTTRHDVKAVEYFLSEYIQKLPNGSQLQTWIHFCCTSEDINNLAYACLIKDSITHILIPELKKRIDELYEWAKTYANAPMLSRTHGQAATPTTLGKEFRVFTDRLLCECATLKNTPIYAKINGASGNFNVHHLCFPHLDWPELGRDFVQSLELRYQPSTTQIEPHDYIASLCHNLIRINTIALDFCQDMWGYISLGYLLQKPSPGQIGSSTMPHKVNPIDFENAEGNLGIANALLGHLARKLPISRWQRDLSDSTTQRNIGVSMGYGLLAWRTIAKGLSRCSVNTDWMKEDLCNHWEVLAEPIQTLLRMNQDNTAYERLLALTQGVQSGKNEYLEMLEKLPLTEVQRKQLQQLSPDQYLGYAQQIASRPLEEI